MKKCICALTCVVLFAFSSVFSRDLTGTYDLVGSNSRGGRVAYRGQVIIEPFGQNYRVIWMIGSNQVQAGIGILDQDELTLSVAYSDMNSNDVGVVSFGVVNDFELEGKWATMNSYSYGWENIIWVSPFTN